MEKTGTRPSNISDTGVSVKYVELKEAVDNENKVYGKRLSNDLGSFEKN